MLWFPESSFLLVHPVLYQRSMVEDVYEQTPVVHVRVQANLVGDGKMLKKEKLRHPEGDVNTCPGSSL